MAILTHQTAFHLLTISALIALLQAEDHKKFLNINCGLPEDTYPDPKTTLLYEWDANFVTTGISKSIANEYKTPDIDRQLHTLRSFPEGRRNCYEVPVSKGTNKYLIRAVFMYGNYDSQNHPPVFDLHIGSEKWDTIDTVNSTMITTKEIIHLKKSCHLDICLVNNGSGVPFISTLELRPLNNDSYSTESGSLVKIGMFDVGLSTKPTLRFPEDPFDRIWTPFLNHSRKWRDISTKEEVDLFGGKNDVRTPNIVMQTASTPANPNEPMEIFINTMDSSRDVMVYMHFAEIVKRQANESRVFNVSLNEQDWFGPVQLDYMHTTSRNRTFTLTSGKFEISLFKVENSTLPPLVNAIEIFSVLDPSETPTSTDKENFEAIKGIKKRFGIKRNWQGDPCLPKEFRWDGLDCRYCKLNEPRIISLNLSNTNLTGQIPDSLSKLTSLKDLDLSNNSLTGSIPDFLSKLTSLNVLNLSGNKLSGVVPAKLLENSNKKLMELSVGGNPDLCASISCHGKKNKAALIVGSIAGVVVLVAGFATVIYFLKKRKQEGVPPQVESSLSMNVEGQGSSELEPKGRSFTYSEVVSMTNNFERVLGKGGFGTVYHGYLDGSEVAVKMLSPSSAQGYKEFRAEVRLLLRVHHRNLTCLVGFCDEGTKMGLIYEYMANGDIEHLLSGPNRNSFKWDMRLKVVVEAAQGLEYLHNGCKPPIVHRDIKPANILLNDKFQAKLADFGLSRLFPIEGGSHISTVIAGTPGYLDPEYSATNWLTEKSDVYSFGIVLLKIITGRPVITIEDGRNVHIYQWVKSLLENGDIKSIVDGALGDDFNVNSVWRALEIAMACASPSSGGRPTMHQVVTELNQCLAEEIARKKQTDSTSSISDEMMGHSLMSDTLPLAR